MYKEDVLLSCVFSRQLWVIIFQHLHMEDAAAPPSTASRFSSCWKKTIKEVPKDMHKGLNSLIILVPGRFGSIGILVFLKVPFFFELRTSPFPLIAVEIQR